MYSLAVCRVASARSRTASSIGVMSSPCNATLVKPSKPLKRIPKCSMASCNRWRYLLFTSAIFHVSFPPNAFGMTTVSPTPFPNTMLTI